jgi:hypothetical protein
MSRWTHEICDACWETQHGQREPMRIVDPREVECCFCGTKNKSGIFVRANPLDIHCGGNGGPHHEDERRA